MRAPDDFSALLDGIGASPAAPPVPDDVTVPGFGKEPAIAESAAAAGSCCRPCGDGVEKHTCSAARTVR